MRARTRDIALIERMARLALRLDVDLVVTHVAARAKEPGPEIEWLSASGRGAEATWQPLRGANAAAVLVAQPADTDVIVAESPRGSRRLFGPASLAQRLVNAGTRELLILAPR